MDSVVVEIVDTPDGAFTAVVDEADRVVASGWTDEVGALLARVPHLSPSVGTGRTAAGEAVRAYYAGELDAVHGIPVAQVGTPLQRAGWEALRRIRPGETLTYTQLAVELGAPRAVRAAASVCARNAPALFVPCHRVLRADGSLGGFAWGVDVKRALLAREHARP